jgi:uncharacterized protein (DUF927 family)
MSFSDPFSSEIGEGDFVEGVDSAYKLMTYAGELGLFFQPPPKPDSDFIPEPVWIASKVEIIARTRDENSLNHGLLLSWKDRDKKQHEWIMPLSLLSGDGSEIRKVLLDGGVSIDIKKANRDHLLKYLQSYPVNAVYRCVFRTGWHRQAFVLPDEVIGSVDDEKIRLQTDMTRIEGYEVRGTLEAWRDDVAAYCRGNHRLVFAISAAFAAPLLTPLNINGCGFHFRGMSSTGKSTALRVAKSVIGNHEKIQQWRTTDNALESLAALHNDTLLCLDELGEAEARTAGAGAYMLANGKGKQRQKRDGVLREQLTWKTLFLSSGELSLADLMKEAGKRSKAGQEVRIIDLYADAGEGLGIFDQIPAGIEGGADFSNYLKEKTSEQHGAAFRAYLSLLIEKLDDCVQTVKSFKTEWLKEQLDNHADGQVRRVADAFATVAAAGELASSMGVTGWAEGEASQAAKVCFSSWVRNRGGTGSQEELVFLRHVQALLEEHGEAQFTPRNVRPKDARTIFKKGYRHDSGDYLVSSQLFRTWLCDGFDVRWCADVLVKRGYLIPSKPDKHGKVSNSGVFKVRTDDDSESAMTGSARCYHIKASILEAEL